MIRDCLMQARHRSRFFQLADVFLSSQLVPAYTMAAFAKRFSRLALTAPPAGKVQAHFHFSSSMCNMQEAQKDKVSMHFTHTLFGILRACMHYMRNFRRTRGSKECEIFPPALILQPTQGQAAAE